MITSTEKPNTARASIHSSFLSKVDRMFDASPRTVFNELIQNARRAGATEVSVYLAANGTGTTVCLRDNGPGLASPENLLCLAASGWGVDVAGSEDPAGMGFFSLSGFEKVKVASRDWHTVFTPKIFTGIDLLEWKTSSMERQGLDISWTWKAMSPRELANSLRDAAKYSGIRVIATGDVDEIHEPQDFLEGCAVFDHPESGYRIGIKARTYGYAHRVQLNFNGVEIQDEAVTPWRIKCSHDVMFLVDVYDTNELPLVLPARNALKHGPGRDKLRENIVRDFYLHVAKHFHGEHDMPYASYVAAQERGIDIGESAPKLINQRTICTETPKEDAVLVSSSSSMEEHIADAYDGDAVLYRTRPEYAGYSWYDKLPHVKEVYIAVDGADYVELGEYEYEGEGGDAFRRVDSIRLKYEFSDAKYDSEVDVDILAPKTDEKDDSWDYIAGCVDILITDAVDCDEAVDYAHEWLFRISDDSGVDDETQSDDFAHEARTAYVTQFVSAADSKLLDMRRTVRDMSFYGNHDATWTISHDRRFGDVPRLIDFNPGLGKSTAEHPETIEHLLATLVVPGALDDRATRVAVQELAVRLYGQKTKLNAK